VTLTSVDAVELISIDLAHLPRLGASRGVSFTNPLTNTGADLHGIDARFTESDVNCQHGNLCPLARVKDTARGERES
jgi:hypothetical protein